MAGKGAVARRPGILVTRPAHQADGLVEVLESLGGRALRLPTLEIVEPGEPGALDRLIAALDGFQLALFVSPNAAERGVARVLRSRPWPQHLAVGAVGKGTARALRAAGLAVEVLPRDGADSEALLRHPRLHEVVGQRIVIFRGEGGRELLAATLRRRGAEVVYAEVYRRRPAAGGGRELAAWLAEGAVDVVSATSSSGLQGLVRLAGAEHAAELQALPLVVVSERMVEHARELGFRGSIRVAAGAGDEALARAALQAARDPS